MPVPAQIAQLPHSGTLRPAPAAVAQLSHLNSLGRDEAHLKGVLATLSQPLLRTRASQVLEWAGEDMEPGQARETLLLGPRLLRPDSRPSTSPQENRATRSRPQTGVRDTKEIGLLPLLPPLDKMEPGGAEGCSCS